MKNENEQTKNEQRSTLMKNKHNKCHFLASEGHIQVAVENPQSLWNRRLCLQCLIFPKKDSRQKSH